MSELTSSSTDILAVDSHVHLYNWVNLVPMLDEALSSFKKAVQEKKEGQPFYGVLVLTEPRDRDTFPKLRAQLQTEQSCRLSSDWTLEKTGESVSLAAVHANGATLFLISGQQVITRESLEVLSIATEQSIPDKMSLEETISRIRDIDGYPVLPWAVGKWLFARGKHITRLIKANHGKPLALGDNGGRPTFWSSVSHFDAAKLYDLPILNGTDPLPAKSTKRMAGSYGTIICYAFDTTRPAASLLAALNDKSCERIGYGELEAPAAFVIDQISLRLP
ncbi:hypothetical protein [Desulfosediminicola flagellatus]|uniref:hypothetical protein n=1 Tax=Desulfosediminicola flagellatus TaxID=2569541 RepID=UPI0010AB993F|nr:hypothetical protein [Desulfosediminicola flagellatus]